MTDSYRSERHSIHPAKHDANTEVARYLHNAVDKPVVVMDTGLGQTVSFLLSNGHKAHHIYVINWNEDDCTALRVRFPTLNVVCSSFEHWVYTQTLETPVAGWFLDGTAGVKQLADDIGRIVGNRMFQAGSVLAWTYAVRSGANKQFGEYRTDTQHHVARDWLDAEMVRIGLESSFWFQPLAGGFQYNNNGSNMTFQLRRVVRVHVHASELSSDLLPHASVVIPPYLIIRWPLIPMKAQRAFLPKTKRLPKRKRKATCM